MNHKLTRITIQKYFKENDEEVFNSVTKRELEVLTLLVKGFNTINISCQLYMGQHTVHQHSNKINRKLSINSFAISFNMHWLSIWYKAYSTIHILNY